MTTPRALLFAVLALAVAACSRTQLNPQCPVGYTFDGEKCVCATDEGCPTGYACEEALCVCRSKECCPNGYDYSAEVETCVCRDESCCPNDHVWLPDQLKCTCGAQDCCPDGYNFAPDAGACQCASEKCCPKGMAFDAKTLACVCASDECCPFFTQTDGGIANYRYDSNRKDCVCASDECCPPNYKYSTNVKACVCVGNACCPAGYVKDPATERCVCLNDASCGGNGNVCDPVTKTCRCTSNAGCKTGDFCNALGFCQALAGCTANLDCPPSTFCDITTNKCIPTTTQCTLDEQCSLDNVCNSQLLSCKSGCRRDGDCTAKSACVGGLCNASFCRTNDWCPVNQFCNTTGGSCGVRSGRSDCKSCQGAASCGTTAIGKDGGVIQTSCLVFVAEGQTGQFCGMHCDDQSDCPSGFDCGGVIFGCQTVGSPCQPDKGETIKCASFLVENETGPQLFCADSSGQPHEYFRACAPSSGFCPASAAP